MSSPQSQSSDGKARGTSTATAVQKRKPKRLFRGAIMYVMASAEAEKLAVEQYLMHDAGAAISQFPSAAQFIIAPCSIDAYRQAQELGPDLGAKVIRLDWVQRSLYHGRVVSRASYWGRPRVIEVPIPTQETRNAERVSIDIRSQDAIPASCESQDPARMASTSAVEKSQSLCPIRQAAVIEAIHGPEDKAASTECHTHESPTLQIDKPSTVTAASTVQEVSVVTPETWSASIPKLNTSTVDRWRPKTNAYVPRPYVPTTQEVPDDPFLRMQAAFNPKPPSAIPSIPAQYGQEKQVQFWSRQPFWIVGNDEAKPDIAHKIQDHGGHITGSLAEATRVIFIRPTDTCDIDDMEIQHAETLRLNDFRPCIAIAETWIHASHGYINPKKWGCFKIRRGHLLTDDDFWDDMESANPADLEDYEKKPPAPKVKKVVLEVAAEGAPLPDSSASGAGDGRPSMATNPYATPVSFAISPAVSLAQTTASSIVISVPSVSVNPPPQDPRLIKRQLEESSIVHQETLAGPEARYPTPVSPILVPLPTTLPLGIDTTCDASSDSATEPDIPLAQLKKSTTSPRTSGSIGEVDNYEDLAGIFSEDEGDIVLVDDADDDDNEPTEEPVLVTPLSVRNGNVQQRKLVNDMQRLVVEPQQPSPRPRTLPTFKKKRKSGDEETLSATTTEETSKKLKPSRTVLSKVLAQDKDEFDALLVLLKKRVNGVGFPEGGIYRFARSIGKVR
ncbi:hypothetical protein IAU59_002094 [Kwoniella sp. CBS 9459]